MKATEDKANRFIECSYRGIRLLNLGRTSHADCCDARLAVKRTIQRNESKDLRRTHTRQVSRLFEVGSNPLINCDCTVAAVNFL